LKKHRTRYGLCQGREEAVAIATHISVHHPVEAMGASQPDRIGDLWEKLGMPLA
jgi:hypothetical protein